MHLLIDAIAIIVLAILIDHFIGELPNSLHPLRWMGNLLSAIDRHIKDRRSWKATAAGFLSYVLVFVLFCSVSLLIVTFVHDVLERFADPLVAEIGWVVATAFIFKITFAVFSFRKHCKPICDDLDAGKTEDAAAKVQMIVSRNTKGMDAEHIASSCCETVSENLVDSVYSPVLYYSILGVPGAVMFRCANLMDAMWGYLNEKYSDLGHFPARFDDVLGFVTSRISPYFVALAGAVLKMDWRAAVPAAKAEHTKTPSPNSGWSMTAVAAVLGIGMEKKGVYYMGTGPLPTTDDVRRCCRLVETASVIYMLVMCVPSMLIGIWIQGYAEIPFHELWGLIF